MRRSMTFAALLLAVLLVSLPGQAQQDVITTAIGGGPNGIPAVDANLYYPYGVAVDPAGNYYVAAYNQNRVFKVNAAGVITVVAGSGVQGYSGDGVVGGAPLASLYHPYGLAFSAGVLYIADYNNCVVRAVNLATSTITTLAGVAASCSAANLNLPAGVAADASGNLFIADHSNCVIRKVVIATKVMSTYAGNGTCGFSGDSGAATAAQLYFPSAIATDSAGNLIIADTNNYVIRKVTKATGVITSIAGTHTAGFSGDGGKATLAQINQVFGVAVNGAGTVVTFADYYNQRIRQFTVNGNITTVAGTGTACAGVCGEGGAAISAGLYYPVGVAVTGAGAIYVGNSVNNVVDRFTVGGNLTGVAGNHTTSTETLITGAPANGVQINYPFGIATDAAGNFFVADSHNYMVRELVKASNLVNFFAGNGAAGYQGDGGAATSAKLNYNYGVAKDSAGNVYIADTNNCLIRKVTAAGAISTFAGVVVNGTTPQCGYTGDGGPATSAKLFYPYGVTVDNSGSVYIADYYNHVVRKVTAGVINTIAGIGQLNGYSGDGGPATNAQLYYPEAIAVDPAGNVFIADSYNCRVRKITAATGIITTVAGTGACVFSGDGLGTSVGLNYPEGLAVDANDNVFIGDANNHRVRWLSPNGTLTTIAGNGTASYNGDGGLATAASMYGPAGVVLDAAGNILVSDYNNFRVRKISVFSALSTSTSNLAYGLTSVGSTSSPQTVKISALGPVTISNISTSTNYSEADNCPGSLANGASCMMYIYFVPTASGSLNGDMTVNSNGFFSQTNTVSLTGLGSALSLSGAPLAFGNQISKTVSAAKVVTLKNNGTTPITMGAITSTNPTDYTISANTCPASGANLAAAASCAISVKFAPKSTGAKRGTIVVNDSDPSSPQLIGLSGTGTSTVVLTPNAITFAATPVGIASAAIKITLTNNSAANITLGTPAITVTGPFLNAATTTCTNNLVIASGGGTCVINAQFKPTAVGFAQGSISVADSDVTSPQTVTLQGNGTGIKFTPATLNFGTVTRGVQVNSTATITNVGTTPLFFTGGEISGTDSANFSVNYGANPPCNNGSNNPLAPGGTCQITVYFNPSKIGAEKAGYKLFFNGLGSPQTLNLQGTGQ